MIYLLVVAFLMVFMRSRSAYSLKGVTVVHNLVLSLGSLGMLVGTVVELYVRYKDSRDYVWFFCEDLRARSRGPLYFWSYVYYLSKYYEMLDTVLVLLQKSRVPHFNLQVYHHAAVVPMAWLWVEYQQSLQWGGLMFNTLVHVFMYQYYAARGMGLPTPWKRLITKLQIVQFATSFLLVGGFVYFTLQRRDTGGCAGTYALLYNLLFNATLLLQFVGVDKKNAENARGAKGEASKKGR